MPEICSDCGRTTERYTVRFDEDGERIITCREHAHGPRGYKPFETYLDTNVDEQPQEITSARQLDGLMKKNNLIVREREHVDDLNHRRWKIGLPPIRK